MAESLAELLEQLARGGAVPDTNMPPLPDRPRIVSRQLQQADVDRRDAEEERRLEVLEPFDAFAVSNRSVRRMRKAEASHAQTPLPRPWTWKSGSTATVVGARDPSR